MRAPRRRGADLLHPTSIFFLILIFFPPSIISHKSLHSNNNHNRIDAAKAELAGAPQYWNLDLPWSISTAAVANSLLMGGIEFFRNSELDPERRCYPGGAFDPLNFADEANPERAFQLKTAEIKHGRLAMVAALGFAVQAGFKGEGALGSLEAFGASF